jgi:hypothetical protein
MPANRSRHYQELYTVDVPVSSQFFAGNSEDQPAPEAGLDTRLQGYPGQRRASTIVWLVQMLAA